MRVCVRVCLCVAVRFEVWPEIVRDQVKDVAVGRQGGRGIGGEGGRRAGEHGGPALFVTGHRTCVRVKVRVSVSVRVRVRV